MGAKTTGRSDPRADLLFDGPACGLSSCSKWSTNCWCPTPRYVRNSFPHTTLCAALRKPSQIIKGGFASHAADLRDSTLPISASAVAREDLADGADRLNDQNVGRLGIAKVGTGKTVDLSQAIDIDVTSLVATRKLAHRGFEGSRDLAPKIVIGFRLTAAASRRGNKVWIAVDILPKISRGSAWPDLAACALALGPLRLAPCLETNSRHNTQSINDPSRMI